MPAASKSHTGNEFCSAQSRGPVADCCDHSYGTLLLNHVSRVFPEFELIARDQFRIAFRDGNLGHGVRIPRDDQCGCTYLTYLRGALRGGSRFARAK